jgi:hypothetical protein
MREKTWQYGTQYKAEVIIATKNILAVKAENDEGFIPMDHGVEELPKEGDLGKIVFMKGGPTGGYWKWFPSLATHSPSKSDKQ